MIDNESEDPNTEIPAKVKARSLDKANRPQGNVITRFFSRFSGNVAKVGTAATLVAGGMAAEAIAHPVQNTIERAAGDQSPDTPPQVLTVAPDRLVDLHHPNSDVEQFNAGAYKKIQEKEAGETILERVRLSKSTLEGSDNSNGMVLVYDYPGNEFNGEEIEPTQLPIGTEFTSDVIVIPGNHPDGPSGWAGGIIQTPTPEGMELRMKWTPTTNVESQPPLGAATDVASY